MGGVGDGRGDAGLSWEVLGTAVVVIVQVLVVLAMVVAALG